MEEIENLKRKTKKLRIVEIVLFIVLIIIVLASIFGYDLLWSLYWGYNTDSGNHISKAQEIQMFNSQFFMYEGTNVLGSNVKDLIKLIEKNNINELEHQVLINNSKKIPQLSKLVNNKKYEVMCEYNMGYVCNIIITERSE